MLRLGLIFEDWNLDAESRKNSLHTINHPGDTKDIFEFYIFKDRIKAIIGEEQDK